MPLFGASTDLEIENPPVERVQEEHPIEGRLIDVARGGLAQVDERGLVRHLRNDEEPGQVAFPCAAMQMVLTIVAGVVD